MIEIRESNTSMVDSVYTAMVNEYGEGQVSRDQVAAAYNMATVLANKYGTSVFEETWPIGFGLDVSKMSYEDVVSMYKSLSGRAEVKYMDSDDGYIELKTAYPKAGEFGSIYIAYVNGSPDNEIGVSVGEK